MAGSQWVNVIDYLFVGNCRLSPRGNFTEAHDTSATGSPNLCSCGGREGHFVIENEVLLSNY